jgi:outer membrane protein
MPRCSPIAAVLCALLLPAFAAAQSARDLPQALAAAEQLAPELVLAELDAETAEWARREARGAFAPSVTVNGALTRNRDEIRVGGDVFVNQWDTAANLQARLTLDPSNVARMRAQTYARDAAVLSEDERRATLRWSVASVYLDLIAAQGIEEARRNAVVARQTTVEAVTLLAAGGYARQLDVQRAELERVTSEAELLDAQAGVRAAAAALAWFTGWSAAELVDGELDLPEFSQSEAPLERAAAARSELLRLAQRQQWRAARWESAPDFSLTGRADFGRSSLRAPRGLDYVFTLGLSWNVFDGTRRARIRAAALEMRRPTLNFAVEERSRRVDLAEASARLDVAEAREMLSLEAAAVASSLESVTREAWRGGDATLPELADAEAARTEAEIDVALARLERERSRLNVSLLEGALEREEWPQ